jgi:hydrogenase expression/formation protein HypE
MPSARLAHARPLDLRNGRIELAFGAGGRAMAQLIGELFARAFANDWLARGDDGAVLPAPGPGERLVMATDAHVVSAAVLPGGDIGSLCGARHDQRSRGDGRASALPRRQLHPRRGFPACRSGPHRRDSMAAAARAAGVRW